MHACVYGILKDVKERQKERGCRNEEVGDGCRQCLEVDVAHKDVIKMHGVSETRASSWSNPSVIVHSPNCS